MARWNAAGKDTSFLEGDLNPGWGSEVVSYVDSDEESDERSDSAEDSDASSFEY